MSPQAKRLKDALKQVGIKDYAGRTPRVRTTVTQKIDRGIRTISYREYGSAVATVSLLNAQQVEQLKAISEYFRFFHYERFTVIES